VSSMLGQRLKSLRIERELKQIDLANMLGISRTTYTQYETEKSEPDLETLTKLANFFNVSVDYLLGRTNIRSINETITDNDSMTGSHEHVDEEWTEEELEEIETFKEFIKMKRGRKAKHKGD